MSIVERVSGIVLICAEPERMADFYQSAFGFRRTSERAIADPAFAVLMAIPGARARGISLQLGEQAVDLVAVAPPGRPYPHGVTGRSPLFQHFAIVVSDMAAAYARLSTVPGWTAISTGGPQALPAASGGVTAFKFRDPEGHPLELIGFPPDAIPAQWHGASAAGCLGIDHSAISVADTARSVTFYQRLGLRRTGGSENAGPEQERLDGIAGAVVEVTALAPPRFSTPHVELLRYRSQAGSAAPRPRTNDAPATQLVLAVPNAAALELLCAQNRDSVLSGPLRFADGAQRALWHDPDGHLLCLTVSP